MAEVVYPDVAERIRWHRAYRKMTQEKYAEAIGQSRTQVKNWEAGSARPSTDAGLIMCERFDLTMDWIYRGVDRDLVADVREAWRKHTGRLNEPAA